MFQTEIIEFIQSFESGWLTSFMQFMTALGYLEFFFLFLTAITFAVDFKKGFIMLLVLIWTGGITYFFKESFSLPRPYHVDSDVQRLDGKLPETGTLSFENMGAEGFLAALPVEVRAASAEAEGIEYGFPSGHTSVAVALWGVFALLFRNRWISLLSIAMIILIPFSRMYLGVHFLADVMGGYILGGLILWLTWHLVIRPPTLDHILAMSNWKPKQDLMTFFLLLAPFALFLILPSRLMMLIGFAFGFGLGFLLLGRNGFPSSEGTLPNRIGRTILATVVFGAVAFVLNYIVSQAGLKESHSAQFIMYVLDGVAFIWLATWANQKIGLFKRMEFA